MKLDEEKTGSGIRPRGVAIVAVGLGIAGMVGIVRGCGEDRQ